MNRARVFLTGGDNIGWAVDEDLRLTRQALEGVVDLVGLSECDVVHSVWWEGLMMIPAEELEGKRIICHVPGEPSRYFTVPEHRRAVSMVGCWVTRTSQASRQMRGFGLETVEIPYLIDVDTFRPLPIDDGMVVSLGEEWDLPADAYLIGSFQRDTEGADLKTPKLVKGPDVLLEILRELQLRDLDVHLVLAGPRRHWLLEKCTELSIPFTYVGQREAGDDLQVNALPRETLNRLYNLLDLYCVASRSEGGPHAILEATASRCKVISSPVGVARDLLEPKCVFESAPDAATIIERDILEGFLHDTEEIHYQRIHENHTAKSAASLFSSLYQDIGWIPIFQGLPPRSGSLDIRATREQSRRMSTRRRPHTRTLTVGLWHSFFKPPYGGGNQFMMALRKALSAQGVNVRENELSEEIDAYILNSIHFDVDRFMDFGSTHRLNIVHRIDGPIHLIRGFDREKDELCFNLNDRFASATVLQSAWTYERIVEMGYMPINPVIIRNAVDSDIFHARGRVPFDENRKIRLISSSWSNNPRKGGPAYKWIEDHLDWDRFEYTFVGNASEEFDRIRHIPPVSSEGLAELLRDHDIYITASRNDPCSNALIEALACGLPALFLDDGGHPELVGQGGLPFRDESEILPQLEKLVEHYDTFQRLIVVSRMEDVAAKYLNLIREVVQ